MPSLQKKYLSAQIGSELSSKTRDRPLQINKKMIVFDFMNRYIYKIDDLLMKYKMSLSGQNNITVRLKKQIKYIYNKAKKTT